MSWMGVVLDARLSRAPVRIDGRRARAIDAVVRERVNQNPIRTVLKLGGVQELLEARKERGLHMQRLRQSRRKKKAAAYNKAWRKENAEHDRQRKEKWRKDNIEHVRAYNRRYEAETPGRRKYKAKKSRQYRAAKRARAQA